MVKFAMSVIATIIVVIVGVYAIQGIWKALYG
jgi:hypothetical protein